MGLGGSIMEQQIDKKYGKLAILETFNIIDKGGRKRTFAKCICDCGNKKDINWDHIQGGRIFSCGCLRKLNISIGERCGRLVVLNIIPHHYENGQRVESRVECRCDCGTIKTYFVHNIKNKNINVSCGCYLREIAGLNNFTHGLSSHYLYRLWRNINKRCYNEHTRGYANYGGRGISNYWKDDAANFIYYIKKELGDRPSKTHSLDRINNNGNYEPGNIRWATQKEQCQNKTHAHQRKIEQLEARIQFLENENKELKRKV
jgi:hypothetical protein